MGARANFFLSCEATAKLSSNKMLGDAIADLFPGVPLGIVNIHTQVACWGGRAARGDVVSFIADGTMMFGELLVTIGVEHDTVNTSALYSIIALWRFLSRSGQWVNFNTEDGDKVVKIRTNDSLRGVHTHRMARDGITCLVHFPECCK